MARRKRMANRAKNVALKSVDSAEKEPESLESQEENTQSLDTEETNEDAEIEVDAAKK